jgi:hypothetical protein
MILISLILFGKFKSLCLLSKWNWFVLASELVVDLSILYLITVQLQEHDAEVMVRTFAGIIYVFILHECGVFRLKKDA